MLIIREIPDTCLSIMWFRQRELCFFIAGRGCGAEAVAVAVRGWRGQRARDPWAPLKKRVSAALAPR